MLSRVPHIRIFISSPMDVQDERNIVVDVIKELQQKLSYFLEIIAWDVGGVPLLADDTPQSSIDFSLPKPSECNIVIVIFGNRLGTPFIDKKTGITYESGTHAELADALTNRRVKPIVYLKEMSSEKPMSEEEERLKQFICQKGGLFFDEDGQAIRAYNLYKSLDGFKVMLTSNLMDVIRRVADEDDVIEDDEMLIHDDEALFKWYHRYSADELLHIPEYELNDQLTCLTQPIPQVMILDNSVYNKNVSEIELVPYAQTEYSIPLKLRAKTNQILDAYKKAKHPYYNSPLMALNDITYNNDKIQLHISKAYFEDGLVTERSLDYRGLEWKNSIRYDIHGDGAFEELKQSTIPNTIGVGALVFTSDLYLIIPIRSSENVYINPNKASPSISGSADYADGKRISSQYSGLLYAIIREGLEELSLEEEHIQSDEIAFLGITREMLRGGKPEAFFAIQLNISLKDIENKWHKAPDKNENKKLAAFYLDKASHTNMQRLTSLDEYGELLLNIEAICRQFGEQVSLPLLTNLVLWLRWKYPNNQS